MTSSNSETPQSVVFVDSQIADYQAIVAAINPGVTVIVYDGAQDGLAQIADDLQGISDLASIDIISHGAADEVQVGTDVLTTSTIPTYAADLAAIGNALAPDGQLDLYGCDVAAAGDGFLTALQQATGRNVAASTDPIGATLLGGTWTLDATTGPTPDALPANLAALQSFDGLLLTTPAQIYFDTWNGDGGGVIGQGNMVEQVTANGSTLVSSNTIINDGSPINPNGPDGDPYPALTYTTGFVVDTALNEYYIASYNPISYIWTIQEGSTSGGGLTTLYTDPFEALNSNNLPGGAPITGGTAVVLGGLALNAATGELYFAQDAEDYNSGDTIAADTGIYKMSVTGGTPTLLTSTSAGLTNPTYLTLDTADNLVFFDDSIVAGTVGDTNFPAVNNLDVANLTTGAVTVLTSFTSSDPNFSLKGLDVDTANDTLYLATADLSDNTSASNAILSIPFSVSGSGSTATASVGAATTLYSGANAFQPTDIVVDAQAGIFYTTGSEPYSVSFDGSGHEAAIFEGSLSGGSALTEVFAVSSVLPTPMEPTGAAAFDTNAPQLFLADIAPVVTAGATATFDGGGSAVTLDSGLIITAGSSATLASATVTLSSGELSSDILSFNGGTDTETFLDGDEITATYSAGVLTLSGTAEVVDYQTALDQVQFSTSPSNADPTNDGSDTSRTLSWVVNDGTSTSTAATSTLDTVHVAPTVMAGGTVNDVSGGAAVRLDPTLSVTDGDSGGNLTGAKVSIVSPLTGDTLSFTAQNNITESSYTNGVLTLTGTATVQQYEAALASITFSTTSTTAGDRTIDWQVSDGSSSNGTSATATSTVGVVVPPVVGGTGNTVQFYQSYASPTMLDGAITAADGNGANITSATVTITNALGAAVGGDALDIPAADITSGKITGTNISFSVSGDELTLSGSDTAGDYQTALREVTYSFSGDPTDSGADKTRTITWSVTDANGQTSAAGSTTTLDVYMTPLLAGAPATTPTVTTTSGAVPADSVLTITDDNAVGTTPVATVTINSAQTGDELLIPAGDLTGNVVNGTGGTITLSNNGSTALTLTGTSSTTATQFQDALQEVAFDATSPHSGPRTLTWVFNDDAGGQTNDSNSFTTSVDAEFGPQITAVVGTPTDGHAVTLSGTGQTVGDSIELFSNNSIVGTGTVVAGDTFDITTTTTFSDGTQTFTAEEFNGPDQVGNTSPAFSVTVAAPAPTNLAQVGTPLNGGHIEITGDGDANGDTITVYASTNGGPATSIGTTTVSGGTFDFTSAGVFADGSYSITATDTSVDTTETSAQSSPAIAAVVTAPAPTNLALVGTPTNGGFIEITGDGDADGDTITVYASTNGGPVTSIGTTTVSGGTFDFKSAPGFADGSYSITATDTSADTTETSAMSSPAITAVVTAPAPTNLAQVGTPLNGGHIEITGDGDANGDTITVYASTNGGPATSIGTTTVSGGTFDFTSAGVFADGSYSITATDTSVDTTETSAQSSPAIAAVVTAPAPTNLALVGTPTNGGFIEITGDGDADGDTITVYASTNGGPVTSIGTTTVSGGTFDFKSAPGFADGSYSITATDTSADTTETSAMSSPAITAVVTAPAPTNLAQVGTPLNGGHIEITGDGDANGDTITVYASTNGGPATSIGTTTVSGGTFDFTSAGVFADGSYSITATDTSVDTTETSAQSSPAIAAVVTAPAPTNLALVGTPTNGGFIEITGDGDADGDTITVYASTNGGPVTSIGTTTVSGGTFDFKSAPGFADGSYSITATDTSADTTETSAMSSPAITANVDPSAPSITTLVGQPLTGQTIELQGTGEVGDIVDLYADGNPNTIVGIGVVDAGGAFDITTTTTFGTGTHTFTATETDTAPLTSAASSPAFQVTVVHQAPAVTAGATATFSGAGPVVLDTGLTVSDVDSGGTLADATVSVSMGFLPGDTLEIGGLTSGSITDSGGTITYAFSGSTLTLSGTDTLADYQAVLDEVTYSFNPSNGDATAAGTDMSRTISWQVNDGSASNGSSNVATSTLAVPSTPVVSATALNINASASQRLTPGQLFSASDAEGEPVLTYEVEDESSGPSHGFWVLNGAVLTNGQITTLTAAQLSQLSFVAGSASSPVTDTLEVAASDAAGLGTFTTFTVTAAAHAPTSAPTVTAANELQAPNLALAGSSLFSGTAFGGNTITSYEVEDTTADSGHWVFNGTVEPTNQIIDVTVAQLAQLTFDTGYGTDTLVVRANDGTQWGNFTSFTVTPPPNAAPPANTTDTLVMLRNADGAFEFYDIGHNAILLDGPLGQISPTLQVAGVGGFNGSDTADLLMRDPGTGAFTLYDVSNDNITGNVALGQVGPEWTVAGFGDFSGHAGETDMLMRNSGSGAFEVYDIANNTITFAGPMGQVGPEWSVAGFGDFSGHAGETDMLMRNSAGAFEVYDIVNNSITFAGPMGQVGPEWSVAGFGDFSGNANETDMLMRNSAGAFEVYDIANNSITFSGPMGQVGLEWTIAGFGEFSGNAGETDMLMRNSNTGAFEVYDIANNAITLATGMGQVGLEWSISGVAANPAAAPPATQLSGIAADPAGAAPSSATAQLTQAMASFAPSPGTTATPSLTQAPGPQASNTTSLLAATNHPQSIS